MRGNESYTKECVGLYDVMTCYKIEDAVSFLQLKHTVHTLEIVM